VAGSRGARALASEGVEQEVEVRPKVTDEELEIERSSRVLNMELTCPVCLRLLTKTEIVMECLHRFCGECIQKCLRVGKNECPSCRIHVPSRRSLRPDPNFDALIARIYPDIDAFERYEERMLADFHKARANTPLQPPQQRLLAGSGGAPSSSSQRAPRSSGQPKRKSSSREYAAAAAAKRPRPAVPTATVNFVNFVLRLHPRETGVASLEREYLETSDQLKVQHLKKFLGLKLKYSPMDDFEILISLEHQCVVLNEHLTLAQILEHFSQHNDLLADDNNVVLHYRLARPTGV